MDQMWIWLPIAWITLFLHQEMEDWETLVASSLSRRLLFTIIYLTYFISGPSGTEMCGGGGGGVLVNGAGPNQNHTTNSNGQGYGGGQGGSQKGKALPGVVLL